MRALVQPKQQSKITEKPFSCMHKSKNTGTNVHGNDLH